MGTDSPAPSEAPSADWTALIQGPMWPPEPIESEPWMPPPLGTEDIFRRGHELPQPSNEQLELMRVALEVLGGRYVTEMLDPQERSNRDRSVMTPNALTADVNWRRYQGALNQWLTTAFVGIPVLHTFFTPAGVVAVYPVLLTFVPYWALNVLGGRHPIIGKGPNNRGIDKGFKEQLLIDIAAQAKAHELLLDNVELNVGERVFPFLPSMLSSMSRDGRRTLARRMAHRTWVVERRMEDALRSAFRDDRLRPELEKLVPDVSDVGSMARAVLTAGSRSLDLGSLYGQGAWESVASPVPKRIRLTPDFNVSWTDEAKWRCYDDLLLTADLIALHFLSELTASLSLQTLDGDKRAAAEYVDVASLVSTDARDRLTNDHTDLLLSACIAAWVGSFGLGSDPRVALTAAAGSMTWTACRLYFLLKCPPMHNWAPLLDGTEHLISGLLISAADRALAHGSPRALRTSHTRTAFATDRPALLTHLPLLSPQDLHSLHADLSRRRIACRQAFSVRFGKDADPIETLKAQCDALVYGSSPMAAPMKLADSGESVHELVQFDLHRTLQAMPRSEIPFEPELPGSLA
jgi:hypothetical protein